MTTTIDTTPDRLSELAERLDCTPGDVVLYLTGYRDSLPALGSAATWDVRGRTAASIASVVRPSVVRPSGRVPVRMADR